MNSIKPKYSIIVPTYNGIKYLPTCIETIISQDYIDYELIISDDHSTDGTREYLHTLNHPNIKIIYPPESLSMTEHWEWALCHAKGDWQLFVGQDDGLQDYFFKLANLLTAQATELKLRTIMSSRAYFFWKGCEHVYGDLAVSYKAENKFRVKSFKYEALKALFNIQDYFELPQMYTTAIFNKSLLDEARTLQKGKVFSCHPQDANLAAIASSLEKNYLKSYIPLGWVGASPRSAGMAISGFAVSEKASSGVRGQQLTLRSEYLNKVEKSKFKYHELAGDFSIGSGPLYFWQSLLMTEKLRSGIVNGVITSRTFKVLFFARILYWLKMSKEVDQLNFKYSQIQHILQINKCNLYTVSICCFLLVILTKPIYFTFRVIKKLMSILTLDSISLYIYWREDEKVEMLSISRQLGIKLKKSRWVL